MWPNREKSRFLRESAQADGGEEIDGESRVPRVVAREQAFEERLQGPADETALFIHLSFTSSVCVCVSEQSTSNAQIHLGGGNSRVLESLVELRKPHVSAQLLEEDLDENTTGGRCRLLAHSHAL